MAVGERRFAITLTDNGAARSFIAQLSLTLDMPDLNGNEWIAPSIGSNAGMGFLDYVPGAPGGPSSDGWVGPGTHLIQQFYDKVLVRL